MRRANPVSPKLLLAYALLLLPSATWGLATDRDQPIHIEADHATLNEQDNTSVYEGNVQLRQGTLQLQGDRMTVLMSNNQLDKIILTGKPASLQQNEGDKDSEQHAEADNIEYIASDERVILLGNARVWQTTNEEFRSERIIFNLKDNTVNAGGTNKQDRVHITLQPKN